MMQDGNAYRTALIERMGDYAKLSPDTMRGMALMDNASNKAGHLDAKVHELIALAVGVTTRFDGCISVHNGG
ncbi:carboxymuconolactone decarboxylase family protein [Luteibacter aegosomatis]|uniref:carboxymuconolactone decarboxylase family protein n=1 Tax=Luteibacter aegosomatis TaxID=2911537 RepID=UPI001FF98360|nr:carboxymuconolactone decarboxylase family protein [Luteibacter aegosomatis]UPG85601.1 carboxymuconolactone decarboxylase family protein [Luteibacter aegosomatis]